MLGEGERVVICHSLSRLLWLRHAATAAPEHVIDRLLLVCPPGTSSLPHELGAFFPAPGDREVLAGSARPAPRAGLHLP